MENNYIGIEHILGNGKVKATTTNKNVTEENNDNCYNISLSDNNGKETNYTVTFEKDIIKATIKVDKTEILKGKHEYDEKIFFLVTTNRANLVNLNEFVGLFANQNGNYNFDSTRVTYKPNILNKIFNKCEVISFVEYNEKSILMNRNNYFLFLKLACEGGNQEIFDYLRLQYENYFYNLSEEQKLILTGSTCFGGNPEIIHELESLKFPFDLNALKGAICGKQFKVFKYLVENNHVDINVKNRRDETILSYLIKNDKVVTDEFDIFDEIFSNCNKNTKEMNNFLFKKSGIKDSEKDEINNLIENLTKEEWDKLYNTRINELTEEDIEHLSEIEINLDGENNKKFIADLIEKIELIMEETVNLTKEKISDSVTERLKKFIKETIADKNKKFTTLEYLSLFWSELNINEKDNDGKTIFYTAVENGDIELYKLLISDPRIQNINEKDNNGETILHAVAKSGNTELYKLLISDSRIIQNINEKDNNGKTVLQVAVENDNIKLVKLIVPDLKFYNIPPFGPTIVDQNLLFLKETDNNSNSPIYIAIEKENPEIIKFFISILSDEEINEFFLGEFNLFQEDPISLAARNPNPEIIKTLLSRLSEQDKKLVLNNEIRNNGNTAIYEAANCKNLEVVKFLLKQKFIDLKNEDIDLINRNFDNNEEIKNLLTAYNKNIKNASTAIENIEMSNDIATLNNGINDVVKYNEKDEQIQKE